jgi:hypothetical protein
VRKIFHVSKTLMNSIGVMLEARSKPCLPLQLVAPWAVARTANGLELDLHPTIAVNG